MHSIIRGVVLATVVIEYKLCPAPLQRSQDAQRYREDLDKKNKRLAVLRQEIVSHMMLL